MVVVGGFVAFGDVLDVLWPLRIPFSARHVEGK
jgi:hypothetical protein